jgi:hypothetical protein
MVAVHVDRLDHVGVIASVINDLGLIDRIHARLVPAAQAVLTPGDAVAGMSLNGLGLANRPLSLPPPFFANKPLDLLCREGLEAAPGNRLKLGRTLAEAYAYGCDLLVQELALGVCARAGIDLRFNHRDSTSVSRSGEYLPESDEQALTITHGYSRAHRPDLKPVVVALMVSEDGGIPFVRQRWDGNTSDIEMFQARAQAWRGAFQQAPQPRSLSADAQLYHEDKATHRRHLGVITRLPTTMGAVAEVITPALAVGCWPRLEDQTRDQRLARCPDGMAQRWLVGSSQAA